MKPDRDKPVRITLRNAKPADLKKSRAKRKTVDYSKYTKRVQKLYSR